MRDDWSSFFTPLDVIVDLSTKRERRATFQFLLLLAGFVLVMIAVIYVVTGRGPQCMLGTKQAEHWSESDLRMKSKAEVARDERGDGPCAKEAEAR